MKKVGSDLYDEGTNDEVEIKRTKTSAEAALIISLGIFLIAIVVGVMAIKPLVNAILP